MSKIILIVICMGIFLPWPLATGENSHRLFSDLAGHWAEEEVLSLCQLGIISGYPDGLFRPDSLLWESHLLKIVVSVLVPGITQGPPENWAQPFFREAEASGWLPWDSFEPERPVLREEAAYIFHQAFFSECVSESAMSFPDVSISSPYAESIEILHQLGILQGKEDGNFDPQEKLTRAEGCVILNRLLGRNWKRTEMESPYGPFSLSIFPANPTCGGFLYAVTTAPSGFSTTLSWGHNEYTPDSGSVVIPIPIGESPGERNITLYASNPAYSTQLSLNLQIKELLSPEETIELPQESLDLMDDTLLQKEREILYSVLDNPGPSPPSLDFQLPVQGPIVSSFGIHRIYVDLWDDYHWGVDISADEGTPIFAAGGGKVVLVEELYSRGKTIVIDHGGGLFTLYYHMLKFEVVAGEIIQKGQQIGQVGMTGAVTGPHLHWEARQGRIPINPLLFLIRMSAI